MGTRSLTIVRDCTGKEAEDVMVMYRQFDGYPDGHGAELAFLLTRLKCRQLAMDGDPMVVNGMEDMAARLVKEFKRCPGNVYLYKAGTRDVWEEYIYYLDFYNRFEYLFHCKAIGTGEETIYSGDPLGFLLQLKSERALVYTSRAIVKKDRVAVLRDDHVVEGTVTGASKNIAEFCDEYAVELDNGNTDLWSSRENSGSGPLFLLGKKNEAGIQFIQ